MRKLTVSASGMPPQVWMTARLALILAIYADVASIPLCITGSFVGYHILIPGLLHAIVGAALHIGLQGLWGKRRWARWFLASLSAPCRSHCLQ